MEAKKYNNEKEVLSENYSKEIDLLKKLNKRLNKFDTKTQSIIDKLEEIREKRKFLSEQNNTDNINSPDLVNFRELYELSKMEDDLDKHKEKSRKLRKSAHKKINDVISKLEEDKEKSLQSEKDKKSFANFISRWFNTMRQTYSDAF